MTRGHDDVVHVRLGEQQRDGRQAPAQFLWRGRLYLVREVLGYWRERQAWWSLEPARAVHGEGGPSGAAPAGGTATATRPVGSRTAQVGADREVWRVEAAPGRSSHGGVYQLARDAPGPLARQAEGTDRGQTWRLLQVLD